ncbi:endolytic transglycosylase MltG [Streptomyces sp. CAU 1734]|uniref:endolytic transglycosylase MltG n=1 Tax=Streptomyces sp. CAU 1734 TaxID=3140360 RepID=UPI003260ADE1
MTEYGRGSGSAPWHPEDPLYGDQGWSGQQDPAAGQGTYGDGGPQQQYGMGHQDPYQQQYGDQQAQYAAGGQQYDTPQYQQQPQQQYGGQGYPEPGYGDQPYPGGHPGDGLNQQAGQSYGGGQQYAAPQAPEQQYTGEQQYAAAGWDAAQQQAGIPYDPAQAVPYSAETPDLYGTPEAYPPPEPPGRRAPEPEPRAEPEAEEESHPFFTGAGDGHDDEDAEPAGSRRGGGRAGRGGGDGRGGGRSGKKQKKSRSGIACLVVSAVLVGGLGGVGYFGYQFWQGKFGPAPDYSGAGSGTVQVEIPEGALGYVIGQVLKKHGVVKSVDAFVAAQKANPEGNKIQAGVYTLSKQMSAAKAVEAMLNPKSRSNLIIPEGTRNAAIYKMIDDQLKLDDGTTKAVAREQADSLGLPQWAKGHDKVKDPLEGFLFPASYPVAKGVKPEAVLKQMVTRANKEYNKLDLAGQARKFDLEGPWELLTAASLVQAEGKTSDDFRKMAEVIYNRLKPNPDINQKLQFDSALNYLKGQSEIRITEAEAHSNPDPYNTYKYPGLTPGPIGNPGLTALSATLDPTKDGWLYFVATDGLEKTEFAKTYDHFLRLKDKFNESGVQ